MLYTKAVKRVNLKNFHQEKKIFFFYFFNVPNDMNYDNHFMM